ncbi:hypothetical protein FACS189449_02030 [Alphaproteobacteria bacterium]|nr:hypothetical protein FACS189449_02030 [Alphaproteobacteria bacterium]
MFGLIFFVCLTVFLISRLNDILGVHMGFKAEIKNDPFTEESDIEEVDSSENEIQKKIDLISKSYSKFNVDDFIEKAKKVFEVVFSAYAGDDKRTLHGLLGKRMYDAFSMAIDDRKSRHEKLEGILVRFISAGIVDAKIEGEDIFVDVKFVTEQSNVLKDIRGKILEGNSDYVEVRTDVWAFGRKKSSADPRWLLYEIKNQE